MSNKRIVILFFIAFFLPFTACAVGNSALNIGVMLPLHKIDGDGRRMVEYYRGMLLAVESLKAEGRNVNVRAWNLPADADPRTVLSADGAADCQVIFGPLYTKQVKPLANFCRTNGVKLVIPFSINGDEADRNECIYQVYQSPEELNAAAIQRIAEDFADRHVVIIDCNDTTSRKGAFTFAMRNVLENQGRKYNITNLRSPDEAFAKAFSLSEDNLVVLNTGRMPELRAALDKLDRLCAGNAAVRCSLFGYTEWLMYAGYLSERFAKYDTYVPTTFYYNNVLPAVKSFERRYGAAFGSPMISALPRFAAAGYDHVMQVAAGRAQWLQAPLNFVKTKSGGWRNRTFMLIHYKTDRGIEALNYDTSQTMTAR